MTERTKLEPLPWFPFNIAEYVKDTMRLTTESHGAYLLLMLDYYGTGEPCPDDDFVLAAVCKLTPDAWEKHKRVLAPFFEIREGHWFHNRIEREMSDAQLKLSLSNARAVAGGKARWAGKGAKPAKRTAPIPKSGTGKRTSSPSSAQAMPEHMPEQSLSNAHLHLPLPTTTTTTREAALQDEGEGSFVPMDWQPTAEQIAQCVIDATADEIEAQRRMFIAYNADRGTFSPDWSATWALWWQRYLERRAKEVAKAKPRVVVDANQPWVPTEKDYRAGLTRFVRGQQWSINLGPEPGHRGCKIPPELIREFGIDPATGMPLAKASAS